MMKIREIIVVLLFTVSILSAGKNVAQAEAPVAPVLTPWPFYIGLGLVMTNIDRDPCPCANGQTIIEDHRYGAVLRAGADFNDFLGLEARVLKTFGSNAFSETTHYGLYLKPQFAVSDAFKIYGLLGYGNTKIDYMNGIKNSTTDEDGVAYGAGVEYTLTKEADGSGWGFWADYSRLLTKKGAKHSTVDLMTAGTIYHF
jgi:opacity protein-like surface antigen